MIDRAEMEAALEAILFASSEPVPRARLLEIFDDEDRAEAAQALAALIGRYAPSAGRGIVAEEVAGGLRLVTPPALGPWLRRFFEVTGASKLSMAALETLAIVAYRQPVTGPEIQELRSVNPSGVLKTLLEKRLVRIAGRKEVVGKPFLYSTTREFLVHFGLKSLADLPPMEELDEALAAAVGDAGDEPAPDGGLDGARDREESILRQAAELAARDDAEPEAARPEPAAGPADPPAGETVEETAHEAAATAGGRR